MVTTRPDAGPTAAVRADRPRGDGTRPHEAGRARLQGIDALRFVAALGVMTYHFTAMWSTAWDRSPGEIFPVLGQASVYFVLAPELFFVVSGFVILWTAWGRDVPAVVGSRVGRLFPPYWAALGLTSLLLLVIWPSAKDLTWRDALANVTLLQEPLGFRHVDGVYWTLWTELRFYLLITVLVAIGMTRRRVVAFAALWPVVALALEHLHSDAVDLLLMPRYAPYFAGGMLLFLLYRDGHSRLLWALVGLNTLLALHTTVETTVSTVAQVTVFEASPVGMAIGVVATFAGVAVLSMTPLARISAWWLPGLGALTYAVYLVHQFWGLWAIDLLHDSLPPHVTLAAAFAVSIALAVGLHHAVEKPLSPRLRRSVERTCRSVVDRARILREAAHGALGRAPAGSPVAADAEIRTIAR